MPKIRTQKQLEQKITNEKKQELIKKVGSKGHSILKSAGKAALKATPPGMMLTAGKALKKEFDRLTKKKKKKKKK